MDENGPVDLPPFILKAKGATPPTVGIALALVFLGGGAGKFMCAWLGARIGMPLTVLATEGGTAALSWAYSFRCSCFYPCWD